MLMNQILNRIFENAKIAYKESILSGNVTIEDKLFSIVTDTNLLMDKLAKMPIQQKSNTQERTVEEEIERVYKKIPNWFAKPNQKNCQILIAFMKISNNNSMSVSVSLLQKSSNEDAHTFTSNYNQMKNISYKNHAKVFEEENGNVKLWKPVADFIIEEYLKKFDDEDKK